MPVTFLISSVSRSGSMEYSGYDQKFESGGIRLYQADCMKMLPQVPDKYYQLCICDPPYGIGENNGQYKSRNINRVDRRNGKPIIINHPGYPIKQWDKKPPNKEYFIELQRVSKNQIIFGGNYFINHLQPTSCFIVWDKCNGGSDFADCELAWTSFKTAVRKFTFMWSGFCQGVGIENGHINQGNKKLCERRIHPTQKPVALYQWLLKNYAKPGDKILDTHGGSCSSAIACDIMGFDFVGYEIDEDYYRAAVERFERHKQQTVLEFA
jgi:site-specific DNA-methyltransferase (adenine-specific)